MNKTVWYKKIGSDDELVQSAILRSKMMGSIGSTYEIRNGSVVRSATVRREGFQEEDYILI